MYIYIYTCVCVCVCVRVCGYMWVCVWCVCVCVKKMCYDLFCSGLLRHTLSNVMISVAFNSQANELLFCFEGYVLYLSTVRRNLVDGTGMR